MCPGGWICREKSAEVGKRESANFTSCILNLDGSGLYDDYEICTIHNPVFASMYLRCSNFSFDVEQLSSQVGRTVSHLRVVDNFLAPISGYSK